MTQAVSTTSAEMPWTQSVAEVAEDLDVNLDAGLDHNKVRFRLRKYGENKLREHKSRSVWSILFDQFKSLIIWLLIAAAAVSFLFGEHLEGWAIIGVILINTLIGFFSEWRAVRSMEALARLGTVSTRVRRDGKVMEVDAAHIVPGDVVIIEGGDVITADLRLAESAQLQVDESALTGESLPVAKQTDRLNTEAILAERSNMAYKGTAVTRGSGSGIVVGTGMNTELGAISAMVGEAGEERTPLEVRLNKLGNKLIFVTIAIAAFIVLTGVFSGEPVYLMIETGIALAVAAIPEGLPIVATIALARGLKIMAERNALINRLSSVETLGATEIVFTDKTGTLTENRMTVRGVYLSRGDIRPGDPSGALASAFMLDETVVDPGEDPDLKLALEVAVLCNNASLSDRKAQTGTGDPLEVALLAVGSKAGLERHHLLKQYPEEREEAFDSEAKMMATWNRMEDHYRVSVKGAPGAVLDRCTQVTEGGEVRPFGETDKSKWLEINNELAAEGLRILALAYKQTDIIEGNPYDNLTFIGLVSMADPPREDVKPALEKCRQAGVRVIMVTGDQAATARYIAEAVGLVTDGQALVIQGKELPGNEQVKASPEIAAHLYEASIFARISPRQKLDLIELYQDKGHVVAMTGDGVNDAPALKKADIGIAMGVRGTQVAQEAADMVLTDDAFSSIVAAIEQGRVIFGNIRRFIYYLMSCNVSEVMAVGLATVAGMPLPILPLQILFLNLVTDVFPALALGVGEGDRNIMQHKPRRSDEAILNIRHWGSIAGYGLIITIAVLGALYLGLSWLNMPYSEAITVSFLTLALAQLWHVFNIRSAGSDLLHNSIVRNPLIWGALVLCVVLLLLVVYVPPLARVLQLTPPSYEEWLLIIFMSLVPLVVGQIGKYVVRSKSAD